MLKRWFVPVSIIVVIVSFVLSGVLQLIITTFPAVGGQIGLPFALAIGLTVLFCNIIIAVMQWLGVSPLDYLPERSLEDSLRRNDPHLFMLTKSKDTGFLLQQAKALREEKKYEWVYLFCTSLIKLKPTEERAYEYLAEALIKISQLLPAIQICQDLLKVNKTNHEAYSYMGDAYNELGDREKAKENYETALQYAPRGARRFVLHDLWKVYKKLGYLDKSVDALKELITLLEPESVRHHEQELQDILDILQRQHKVNPTPPE